MGSPAGVIVLPGTAGAAAGPPPPVGGPPRELPRDEGPPRTAPEPPREGLAPRAGLWPRAREPRGPGGTLRDMTKERLG